MSPEENFQSKLNPSNLGSNWGQNGGGVDQQDQTKVESAPSEETEEMKSAKVRTFSSSLDKHKDQFKRPVNQTGTGATRLRTFHVRLSETAMIFLDDHINEWLDNNPDIEIKFCSTTIGKFEGKRGSENQLIMNVWY